ncbi:MAG: PAS domain-containing protein [Bradyrhizobium sp.]
MSSGELNSAEFQLGALSDPRLALHAISALPAWLWSLDGTRVLWSNPVGAKLFGAANAAALLQKTFGPADAHRRQVAQLSTRLPPSGAIRLQRLRGFGAPLGILVACGCARLGFGGGNEAILVAVAESVGHTIPLIERLQRLIEGIDRPIAVFTANGMFIAASDAARPLLGYRNLSEAGLEQVRKDALKQGRAEGLSGQVVLQRLGSGADIGLVALIAPGASLTADSKYIEEEAPAELVLIDEFAEGSTEPAAEIALPSALQQPDPPMVLPLERAACAETSKQAATSASKGDAHEPSALIEAVADEPSTGPVEPCPSSDEPEPNPRRHPLRFMWQMDAGTRFTIESDEFTSLIGPRTAAGFGRLWGEIAEAFALDPDGRVLSAVATRDTWSGITLNWPSDGGGRLPVELSGLPIFDQTRNFAGYRGFGVCRDLEGLTRLAALRRAPSAEPAELPGETISSTPVSTIASDTSPPTDLEKPVDTPKNVVPFRPIGEPKPPVLTSVENSAFDELARQLSARLESENGASSESPAVTEAGEAATKHLVAAATREVSEQPSWLAQAEPAPQGETRRDRTLLDLLPVGVLIYRLDRLVYANSAFLKQMGYSSLHALEEAGGLDALYVEAGVSGSSSTSDTGTPVTISGPQTSSEHSAASIEARLYTIAWDDESALALIFSGRAAETRAIAAAIGEPPPAPAPAPAPAPSPVGHANAEELGAILDTMTDGIVMFDAEGNLNSCNRSAEALFGYDGDELMRAKFSELFAPESQRVISDYLESIKGSGLASLLDHGRDVLGRASRGGIIPLSMTMGRTRHDGPNFFAVFRDLSQTRKSESELQQARRLADRAANAKADLLARISHEVRTPLNAIIGFAEVMVGERFGALGNQRYVEYMKDIRASGERVITIIDDLLDLSRIETGKLELTFSNQNLNDLVEQCVAVMQPQANRERIIIRTSLGRALPAVVADARALRQIALNLIGNSIHLANAGGQVIVSTALSDFGEVVLRVRDTGQGLSDNEVAAAMEPFRTRAPSDQALDSSPVSLSLTKALVEANRGQFQIKTGPHSGTLIEVVFSRQMVKT